MISNALRRRIGDHYPVMWRNIIDVIESNFQTSQKLLVGDATLGAGGHSRSVLEMFQNAYIIGTDIDGEMAQRATSFTSNFQDRIKVNHTSYTNLFTIPRFANIFPPNKGFDVIIADFGLSSVHLDAPNRGFSFRSDGPLDMRFDQSNNNLLTAEKILNYASELELIEIFKKYGEEPHSHIAAEIICKYRKEVKITSTAQLTKILNYAFFLAKSVTKYDSITRIYQALRIKINSELENIENFMDLAIKNLEENGVMIAISFQPLEDRIVNLKMKEAVFFI